MRKFGAPYDGTSPLFGTTQQGGAHNLGEVYRLAQKSSGAWRLPESLLDFCAKQACADGENPFGPVTVDAAGHLYGTAQGDGRQNFGVIYRLDVTGKGATETVLHKFCINDPGCTQGEFPQGPLVIDSTGRLIGVASSGAAHNAGVIFRMWADGSHYQVLHTFCSLPQCADGFNPQAITIDANDTVYGTTMTGGPGDGVLFKLQGTTYTALHNFCVDYPTCSDGEAPAWFAPTIGAAGHIFGTTVVGGAHSRGVVYEYTP